MLMMWNNLNIGENVYWLKKTFRKINSHYFVKLKIIILYGYGSIHQWTWVYLIFWNRNSWSHYQWLKSFMSISFWGGVERPEPHRLRQPTRGEKGNISGAYFFLVGLPKQGGRVPKTNCLFHMIPLFVCLLFYFL